MKGVSIGVSPEVSVDTIRYYVNYFEEKGYKVYNPIICGEALNYMSKAAEVYLRASIDNSSIFFILNEDIDDSEFLSDMRAYAVSKGVQVIERL